MASILACVVLRKEHESIFCIELEFNLSLEGRCLQETVLPVMRTTEAIAKDYHSLSNDVVSVVVVWSQDDVYCVPSGLVRVVVQRKQYIISTCFAADEPNQLRS